MPGVAGETAQQDAVGRRVVEGVAVLVGAERLLGAGSTILLDKGVDLTGPLANPRKVKEGFFEREQVWDVNRCEWR